MRTTTALVLAVGTASLPLALMTFGLVLLFYLGVVLPAVWSASAARRKAATELLLLFRGRRAK